jgi:uncharacterized protein (TIGR02266 family)
MRGGKGMKQTQEAVVKKGLRRKPDTRVAPRVPMMVLEVKGRDGNQVFLGYAKNISQGGLFVSGRAPLSVGERFPMEFVLPDNKTKVQCTCEVVWRRRYGRNDVVSGGMGIKFVDLSERVKRVIGTWVKRTNQQGRG